MSVSNTDPRLSIEAGNDVETDFDFQFKIFAKTDLKCWKVSAAGVFTPGLVDVDFTVVFDNEAETGTVTWAVAPVTGGYSVIAGSEIPLTQGTIFSREGVTPSRTTKSVTDKLTILLQQLSDAVYGRAILKSETLDLLDREDITVSELPSDGKLLVYERNDADDGWNIVPSDDTLEDLLADIALVAVEAAAAAVSAAAASASSAAATASASAASASAVTAAAAAAAMVGSSGLAAAKPANGGAYRTYYYSTDFDQEEMWSPLAQRWMLVG